MQWMLVLFFALDNPCDVLRQSSVGPFSPPMSTSPWSWDWEQRYKVLWGVFFSVGLSVSNFLLEQFSNHISSKNLSLIALGYIEKKKKAQFYFEVLKRIDLYHFFSIQNWLKILSFPSISRCFLPSCIANCLR